MGDNSSYSWISALHTFCRRFSVVTVRTREDPPSQGRYCWVLNATEVLPVAHPHALRADMILVFSSDRLEGLDPFLMLQQRSLLQMDMSAIPVLFVETL